MNIYLALLRRELLEHKYLLRVPAILIVIAVLVRLSLVFGNLSIDVDLPDQLQLDKAIDGVMNSVVVKALSSMNYIIMLAMFIVAIFYTLACLYNERQDDSVLFWRSLPISDSSTVASKLMVALVMVPLLLIITQVVVVILFLGINSFDYLLQVYPSSLSTVVKILLWSMLPTVAWCLFCSQFAKKNPFLLAFIAPVLLVLFDKLFLNGVISDLFVINRLTGVDSYSLAPLLTGTLFGIVCVVLAVMKRTERI